MVMAVFWHALYILVNLTSILWLDSIAVTQVAGINQDVALVVLGVFALLYPLIYERRIKGGDAHRYRSSSLLVFGGLVLSYLTLSRIGGDGGLVGGFARLTTGLLESWT